MAKEVINVNGQEETVREDTAKSYRGVMWALATVAAVVAIAAILFFVFGMGSVGDGKGLQSPGQIENTTRR